MLQQIQESATAVGITAVITNSEQRIETQLNSLTTRAKLPLMLINWDIDTNLNFNEHGLLDNPSAVITALLVKKATGTGKAGKETAADEMGELFQNFIKNLYSRMIPLMTSSTTPPITGATYKRVPSHGAGKHSGVLARWTMRTGIASGLNC